MSAAGEFAGRVALVTAAAGVGVGQAVARRLAEGGAHVVVTDSHVRRTAEVAERMSADFPAVRILGLPLDVGDLAQIDAVVTRNGQQVTDLNAADFEVFEDGKPQTIAVFDLEKLGSDPLPAIEPEPKALKTRDKPPAPKTETPAAKPKDPNPAQVRHQDKRLIAMFFDFSTMQPAEQIRAKEAINFFEDDVSELEVDYPDLSKFVRTAHEFAVYIASNTVSLINYANDTVPASASPPV